MKCDLFCAVIDNFGDAGVCWRLARQLQREHGVAVTLWIDDLDRLQAMSPQALMATTGATLEGVEVRAMASVPADFRAGDLVIAGFSCALPDVVRQALSTAGGRSLLIQLEYLSAEAWVDDCHGLSSPDPVSGRPSFFFFPGFTAASGGLLREQGLLPERTAFQQDADARARCLSALGCPPDWLPARQISLFCYRQAPVAELLGVLVAAPSRSVLWVSAGPVLDELAACCGVTRLVPGDQHLQGNLLVRVLPFLPHQDYDRLLWACDLNIVRGEDSFVRAQWAARPLLWHIYPTDDDAHHDKLRAWLTAVAACAGPAPAWQTAQLAWNGAGAGVGTLAAALSQWLAAPAGWQRVAEVWSGHLAATEDLASRLMRFYADRVESPPVKTHPGINTR